MKSHHWVTLLAGCAAVLSGSWLLAADMAPTQVAPHYKLVKSVSLGAPDRWDYVVFDPATRRVFVAHGDRVTVVDGTDGSVVGQVEGFAGGTHGIALVNELSVGYTDDGRAGEAGAFDLKTLKPVKRIAAAPDADGMVFDPASQHVFVINGDSGSVTVIDPRQQVAIATIQAGEALEYGVVDAQGKLFVNGSEKKELLRIDTHTNQIDARWPIPDCTSPHGLGIDTANHRLFSSCVNDRLMVVSTDSGAVVATLPIGSGSDAVAFDPKRKLIFSSNGRDGTLSVLLEQDPQNFKFLETVTTTPSARTMSIDPATGRLYIAAAEFEPLPPGSASRTRPTVVPGTFKLLFFDPL
jgi:YVTN family beta-propeller protein